MYVRACCGERSRPAGMDRRSHRQCRRPSVAPVADSVSGRHVRPESLLLPRTRRKPRCRRHHQLHEPKKRPRLLRCGDNSSINLPQDSEQPLAVSHHLEPHLEIRARSGRSRCDRKRPVETAADCKSWTPRRGRLAGSSVRAPAGPLSLRQISPCRRQRNLIPGLRPLDEHHRKSLITGLP